MKRVRLLLHPQSERNRSMVLYAERLVANAPGGTDWFVERLPSLPGAVGARLSELVVPPVTLPRMRDDLVHVVDHAHAGYLRYTGGPTVVTVHDLVPLKAERGDYPPLANAGVPRRVALWFRWNLAVLDRADAIVTPSRATADEMRRMLGRIDVPIEVVPHGIDSVFVEGPSTEATAEVRRKLAPVAGRKIMLQVSNGHFYKNDPCFVEAFLQLAERDADWAWVRVGSPLPDETMALLASRGLSDRFVSFSGSADELAALYREATLLFYPSWDEGFGWPPVEAMASGCPVASTDLGALAETSAPAALGIPADDPTEAARRVRERFESADAVRELVEAGLEHAAHYRWDLAASRMAGVYAAAGG